MFTQPVSHRDVVNLERKIGGQERGCKDQQSHRPCVAEGGIMTEDILHIKENVAVVRNVERERDFAQKGADTGSSLARERTSGTDIDD